MPASTRKTKAVAEKSADITEALEAEPLAELPEPEPALDVRQPGPLGECEECEDELNQAIVALHGHSPSKPAKPVLKLLCEDCEAEFELNQTIQFRDHAHTKHRRSLTKLERTPRR